MSPPDPSAREQYIQHQRGWLAACATGEWLSGPRRYPEEEHAYRTCFQRDRDRVIHCSAFRRLDYKTQVFVPHEQDHYHTRMTHTLEVAQIGRNLARALRANEDLVETAALAHDLGHPPFGHAGEAALDELMADHGHFEHNRQSLRTVDYLEHPYPAFRGLNLTQAVRQCLAKHTTRYDTPLGEEFDNALLAPIEGQLVDACDEIAYTSADLEDALQARWITREQIEHLELWRMAWDIAARQDPGAREIHLQIRATKALLAIMADDVVATTRANIATMGLDCPQAVQQAPHKCIAFSGPIGQAVRAMQDFLFRQVYTNAASQIKTAESRQCIRALFQTFIAHPDLLPPRYQGRIESDGLHRLVCDYIAGMTDRYCRTEYERLAAGTT